MRKKSSKTAAGPDGISRQDLLSLPDDLVARILQVYERAETTGRWPPQTTEGLVTSLEKHALADGPGAYRPITVLSLVYRTWSSVRARQIIKQLNGEIDQGIAGNMPNQSAANVWWNLQCGIEITGNEQGGLGWWRTSPSVCFNHLPRDVVFAMAVAIGIPGRSHQCTCPEVQDQTSGRTSRVVPHRFSRRLWTQLCCHDPCQSDTCYLYAAGVSVHTDHQFRGQLGVCAK